MDCFGRHLEGNCMATHGAIHSVRQPVRDTCSPRGAAHGGAERVEEKFTRSDCAVRRCEGPFAAKGNKLPEASKKGP